MAVPLGYNQHLTSAQHCPFPRFPACYFSLVLLWQLPQESAIALHPLRFILSDSVKLDIRQFFVTVVGAVQTPGKFPYVPNRTYDYYIGLAGGFDEEKNDFSAVNIMDMAGNKKTKDDIILPEYTIKAKSNSFLYNFNQYAPVISTVLTLITTFFAVTALFN